jgi:hypothetical protein
MPVALKTIEEIVATQFKRQGYWMVFNRTYNDLHAFRKEVDHSRYLKKEETDESARAEFITYMQENFPDVKTYQVFDLVSTCHIVWPYLGSIAIDMDEGDAVYQALCAKYNDPADDGNSNTAVLWTVSYEDAVTFHEERVALSELD